ncbi:MAG TPA: MarR family transcriptional regulator [Anaerolineae bacterium]|nr:MarR family transcriptional regulator [Anaerolineae bacterium]
MSDFSLDTSLGFVINRTAQRLKLELQHAFKAQGYDITPEQWAVLSRLWEQEGLNQVELAERTFKDKPNVTRMLDVLERRGFVIRQKDDTDRRAYRVFLTEPGRQLQAKLVPLAVEVLEKGQKYLSEAEISTVIVLLNRIYASYD